MTPTDREEGPKQEILLWAKNLAQRLIGSRHRLARRLWQWIALLTITAIALLNGCAGTRDLYSQAGKTFAEGYGVATTAIDHELANITSSRRLLLASDYFQGNPDNTDRAFAEFACAGAGAALDVRRELAALKAYHETIASLSELSPEEISGLIKSIATVPKPLEQTGPSESAGPANPDALRFAEELGFRVCTMYVQRNIPPSSDGVIPPKTIKPILEFEATLFQVQKGYALIKDVIVLILKSVDDAARVAKLRTYVQESKDEIEGILQNIGNSSSLRTAFEIRKRASLVQPYYRFKELLQIPSTEPDRKLVALEKTRLSLAEFDRLREKQHPPDVVGVMRKAQTELDRIAAEGFAPDDFQNALEQLETIRERIREFLKLFETRESNK